MKIYKRIITIMLTIIMALNMNMISFAGEHKELSSNEKIVLLKAEEVAIFHVKSVMATNEDSPWNSGVRISQRKAMFDINNEISAYYLELENKNKEPAGYIVVGANMGEFPIIEYSDMGVSFLDMGLQNTKSKIEEDSGLNVKENSSKVLYLGNLFYAVEHTMENEETITYDITTSDCSKMELSDITDKNTDDLADIIQEAWNFYETNTGGSNPPDSGEDFITNPSNYESGYDSVNHFIITNGARYYNTMTDFADSNAKVCAPTAATNLCKYWYLRDTSRFVNLFKDCSWDSVFDSFVDYMETSYYETGTSDYNVADAYRLFFDEVGLSCQAWFSSGTNNGRYIVNELDNDRPCHLMVHDHYLYGNHSVLAVGYAEYKYGSSYSTYIRIADGWTNYPSRYVWGPCNGSWCYVVVIPD